MPPLNIEAVKLSAAELSAQTEALTHQFSQLVQQGLDAALHRKAPTRVYTRSLDGAAEAHAYSADTPPKDRQRSRADS